jgi:lipoprotein-anchoring transpeptidase ErfK/SrfK
LRNPTLPRRALALALATVLLALSASIAVAVTDDYLGREIMPAGAAAADVDLGGLTRAEASDAVRSRIVEPLSAPVSVECSDTTLPLNAAEFVDVDVDGMVAQAFAPKAASSLPVRVYDRLSGTPRGARVEPLLQVKKDALAAWLDAAADAVDEPAVDATLIVEDRVMRLTPSRPGAKLNRERTLDTLVAALTKGTKTVAATVEVVKPKVAEADLGTAILVRRSDRRLMLYDNGALTKTYRVAVGTPGYPTPRGTWKIVQKRYLPTWGNPGSDWAKDMPAFIPPGPNNPLGTRALNLNASGIRIHGTSNDSSIGTAASHGCMRMHRWDIEDLYPRVDVGTPVIVID